MTLSVVADLGLSIHVIPDLVSVLTPQVNAELNYSDLLTVTDMVCSTAFDRDDEFFATAGVFRRVKIFDFASVQDSDTSIHYPVLEIPSRSVTWVFCC